MASESCRERERERDKTFYPQYAYINEAVFEMPIIKTELIYQNCYPKYTFHDVPPIVVYS
jgi:hypothetical protein